jgi:LuxR family maltose regulon positive regulatory protein
MDRLLAAPGIQLTVLAAPPGAGKSTLLGTWLEVEAKTRPVAWLSLDEDDNDPVVLWSYVLAALRGAVPALKLSASPESVGAARITDLFLPVLVNELTLRGPVVLVLDDFHRLSNGPARESMAWFIEHAPKTFRLILATRNEPALPLARLRAHSSLLELRAAELAFTPDEAEELLNRRLELGLRAERLADLVSRTEGWPAGLYLAGLSLQAADDRDALASRFGGESRYVVDFLMDEVLAAHDPATQELMLRSSILERLSGPLCDAVLQQEGSGKALERLSRANLFLLPLDDNRQWYRFHHLYAQLLRAELDEREPGFAPELHRRAFEWHRANGSIDTAIEHALAAAAYAEAGELVASVWFDYANTGRDGKVLGWLDRLPGELVHDDSRLLLISAWTNALLRRDREASLAAVASLERRGALAPGPLPDGFSSLEASLSTLRGWFTWGDLGSALPYARRAVELEARGSPRRHIACAGLAQDLYYSGELHEADTYFAEAVDLTLSLGQWRLAAVALAFRSFCASDQAKVDDQSRFATEADLLAREQGVEDGGVPLALALAFLKQGDRERAWPLFERSVSDFRIAGYPLPLAHALIESAKAFSAAGRREESAAAIAEATAILDACPDPGVLASQLASLKRAAGTRWQADKTALSPRELAILRMLSGPLSERDIGRELYLSHSTIHSHTKSIYRKLEVSSRSEALRRARELDLI